MSQPPVDAEEALSRFLTQPKNHFAPTTGRLRYAAFLPNKALQTSVYRILGLTPDEVWSIGDVLVGAPLGKPIPARADIGAKAVSLRRVRSAEPALRTQASQRDNVIEQMGLRVAKAFENSLDDDKGWHTELIRRLSIRIPGVRPALFSEEIRQPLQELRAFRHVFVHAYDLDVDPDKLALVLKYGRTSADRLQHVVMLRRRAG